MLLPDMQHVSGTEFFVFQQQSALLTEPRKQCCTETPDFIPPTLYSLDLNPVDYCVWNVLQGRVYYCIKVDNVVDLKQCIVAEWTGQLLIIASSRRPMLSGVCDCMLVFALPVDILSIVCSDINHSSRNKY